MLVSSAFRWSPDNHGLEGFAQKPLAKRPIHWNHDSDQLEPTTQFHLHVSHRFVIAFCKPKAHKMFLTKVLGSGGAIGDYCLDPWSVPTRKSQICNGENSIAPL
jgi:hypothetical protein